MSRRNRAKRLPADPVEVTIESLSPEGRGVCHVDGKVVFVDFALAGETVKMQYTRRTSKFDEGRALEVLKASAHRVTPPCEYFGYCGGCSLQHMAPDAQIQFKQDSLLNQFQHIASTQPDSVLPALTGPTVGYRRRARLGMRYVAKKGRVLVGFREKSTSILADIKSCKVLHPSVGERLMVISEALTDMGARQTLPQIEVAVTDNCTSLLLRHLEPLSDQDRKRLCEFADQNDFQIRLQPGGEDSVQSFWPENMESLHYFLPDHDVRIDFSATDFTQVNSDINEKMIDRAIELLELDKHDRVLDLFCGLGNFTLPMARYCEHVTGVEGSEAMVHKARHNAEINRLDNVEFYCADLFEDCSELAWMRRDYTKILLDPARAGAQEIISSLKKQPVKRIVYVSCNPSTLARDTNILVNQLGFKLSSAGVMDMFPHTAHVESIALFVKE